MYLLFVWIAWWYHKGKNIYLGCIPYPALLSKITYHTLTRGISKQLEVELIPPFLPITHDTPRSGHIMFVPIIYVR